MYEIHDQSRHVATRPSLRVTEKSQGSPSLRWSAHVALCYVSLGLSKCVFRRVPGPHFDSQIGRGNGVGGFSDYSHQRSSLDTVIGSSQILNCWFGKQAKPG
jgi:hypothetical protein